MDPDSNETAIRVAYDAYVAGDIEQLLAIFSEDLDWTFLDPSVENPEPQTCRGLAELQRALRRQAGLGLQASIEEVLVNGDDVVTVIHIPGLDQYRARQADDRNYDVFTFRQGRIVALRACRSRAEALQVAGIT